MTGFLPLYFAGSGTGIFLAALRNPGRHTYWVYDAYLDIISFSEIY
jgi:hypothetical protein